MTSLNRVLRPAGKENLWAYEEKGLGFPDRRAPSIEGDVEDDEGLMMERGRRAGAAAAAVVDTLDVIGGGGGSACCEKDRDCGNGEGSGEGGGGGRLGVNDDEVCAFMALV